VVVEQIIRPTGLVDPEIEVRPVARDRSTTSWRRSAGARREGGARARDHAHQADGRGPDRLPREAGVACATCTATSPLSSAWRSSAELRLGEFDVLVGINLLREGLDLPEVSLVAILDADKEGFLRSETSLIQTAGRAARNVNGTVIFYADKITGSMQRALDETERRRERRSPTTRSTASLRRASSRHDSKMLDLMPGMDTSQMIEILEEQMLQAAAELEFEKAASFRDRIDDLRMTALAGGARKSAKRGGEKKGAPGVAPPRRAPRRKKDEPRPPKPNIIRGDDRRRRKR
jgi:excinuclease ABC subunit B